MSSRNYETQILDSIQMIVDNAISKAEFDKTIKAIVSEVSNAAEGKYIVKYQGNSMVVYSSNPETRYTIGAEVYVLIPGNDTQQKKTIIGAVNNLGLDYISLAEGDAGYEINGTNIINSDRTFELCSYVPTVKKVLYDRDNNIDLINFNTKSFDIYTKQSNYLICGATFRTALPQDQQIQGNYGIAFDIDYQNDTEIITKTYIVDTDDMVGTPYNLITDTRQYAIFKIENQNILSVKQIYVFNYNFPLNEEEPLNNIFISNIELKAANELTKDEFSSTILTLITKEGTYFDKTHLDTDSLSIEAQIKIKGRVLGEEADIKYYWFKEDNQITNNHILYNRMGGAGWRCLNQYNPYDNETQNIEWVPAKNIFNTIKNDNIAKETHYKCIAIYNNITVEKEFTITNFDSIYEISIQSDEGAQFYHDNGKPSLVCLINGEDRSSDEYTYLWSKVDNNNRSSILSETSDANIAYNAAIATKEQLLAEIAAESKLTGEIQEELDECNATIEYYNNKTRIEKNKIYKINLKEITNYAIYKCSVFKNTILLGVATFKIVNDITTNISYNLVINNGNQVFKYNEAGVAPNSDSAIEPVEILPLTFTLYDKDGKEVDKSFIGLDNISWKAPLQHTMIEETDLYEIKEETDDYIEYYRTQTFDFNIRSTYVATHKNNNIQLTVKYKDNIITAITDFTFIKTGEPGTNGTEYICKMLPNTVDVYTGYPIVTYDIANDSYSLNCRTIENDKWFKINFWKNGELIYSDTKSGYTKEGQTITLEWSMLANNYGKDFQDYSNFNVDKDTGAIVFNKENHDNPANIIKCKITYNNQEYFATMPIILVKVANDSYQISLEDKTGFQEVMYTANGTNPVYNEAKPFTIQVLENINSKWEDVSLLEQEYSVDYDWNVKGQVYYSYWQSEQNLLEKTTYLLKTQKNQKYFEPADTFNGLCVNNAIECVISRGETEIGSIHIPVYLYLNRYGNSAINGWDGNSISIDENNSGMILAPQVGAGKKNADNSFTGIFMGSVKEQGAPKEEHGLFGYNAGQRTIALNAEDGSARFGATGKGQIVIDPSTGNALIESGNFNTEAGTGMRIDLSEPSIEFGSGKFKVDKYGQLTASGFSTIEYVDKKKDEIIQEVEGMLDESPLKVELSTENLFIPCNENNVPINEATYNIDFSGTIDGTPIEAGELEVLYDGKDYDNTAGFPVETDNNIDISLTNNSTVQQLHFSVKNEGVLDEIQIPSNSTYRFNFTYLQDENTSYTITKIITITVLPPGAPGKSAYDIWLDQGNIGTEQDYLNSLKGADASSTMLETERQFTGFETQTLTNSGDHEIPLLYVYGNYKQEIEYTENIMAGFAVSIANGNYWSERPSKMQVTNLEDGWGRLVLDNSSGTSTLAETIAINADYINWEFDTDYTLVAEIRNSSMSGSYSKFYAMGGSGTGRVHMFDEGAWSLDANQINTGGVYYSNVWKTLSHETWNSYPIALFASAGTVSTVEVRLSVFKGKLEIDTENFEYTPCECIQPSIDNPSPIKTLGFQNLINQEDWYNTYAAVNSERIKEETKEGNKAYKLQASGLTSIKYMEGQFKENTVYRLSFRGCQEVATNYATLYFQFVYTDGSTSSVYVPTAASLTKRAGTSTEGKTISYLRINASTSYATKWVYITDLMLSEGYKLQNYIPYGKYGLDLTINSKNLINIFTLIPGKTLNYNTGAEENSSYQVISPFIKLEGITYLQARWARLYYFYYDKNYNFLGYGENLSKSSSPSITSTNNVPYELNSNIYYVRIKYVGDWSATPTEDLTAALKTYNFNSEDFIVIGEKSLTEKLIYNGPNNNYLKQYTIALDQPLSRVQHSHVPEKDLVKDTVAIEDGIVQITYNTHYIVWDGTEPDWILDAETDDYIAFSMIDPYGIDWDAYHKPIISSHFAPGARLWSYDINGKAVEDLWVRGDYIGIQIAKNRLTQNTVEGFKEWLHNNPITLIAGREKALTKTAFDGCNLKTMKNVSHLHLENNTLNPELTGIYYTGFKGNSGDSIICKITPSSQMFKSVDGPNGPFTPDEIYLFPEIFNTYFKAWYYSIDSINWEPVISGEHGLEIGTFSEKPNTLKISNTCDLYTEEDTTVSFKCVTYNDSVYDVATIAKSYDLVDLTVGGRNFMLKSHIFDDAKEWGLESVLKTDDEGNPIIMNGQEVRWYLTEVKENDVVVLDGTPAEGISAETKEESTGEQYIEITANKDNKGRIHWIHSNTAETYLEDGDQFVFSCEIWTPGGIVNNVPPLFHYHSSVGYLPMEGEVTTEKSRIICSGVWKEVEGYNTDFRFDFTGLEGTYCLTKFKLEKGKNPTDWTLAPEDLETIADLEYCIGNSKEIPPAADNPAWGAQTLYKPNLEDGDYLWSRVKNTATSGLITYTSYSCVLTYQKELVSQKTEYLLCNIGDEHRILAQQDNPEWTTVKPTEFKVENSQVVASKLWSRQHLIYKTYLDGIIQEVDMYTNYTLDTAWEKSLFVETELTTKVNQIILNTNEGFVRIQDGNIVIGDSNKDPQHLIVMNHYGISFIDRGEGAKDWPTKEEIEQATEKTTAWTIDGSLDMNFIKTEELEATYIKNENLILGNKDGRFINDKFETVDAGDLDIYDKDGHLIFETVTSKSTGASETAFWIEGFKIHQYEVSEDWNSWKSTGYIYLSSANGFGEFDAQKKIIYGNQGGVWFSRVSETERHIIAATENEVKYGIQMIPMSFTENGITHRGLAFIRVDAE